MTLSGSVLTLVDIITSKSVPAETNVTLAFVRTIVVNTGSICVTVISFGQTLVQIETLISRTSVPFDTVTLVRADSINALSIDITIVSLCETLVNVSAFFLTIAFPTDVAVALKSANCVITRGIVNTAVNSKQALINVRTEPNGTVT